MITVADKEKHFGEAIQEFKKRLGKKVEYSPLKPEKSGSPELIRIVETKKILDEMGKYPGCKAILLDEKGSSLSTQGLCDMVEVSQNESQKLLFIIGGAYGIDREILFQQIDKVYKLSDLILPHGMAFMVLLEQIYRVFEIQKGSKYHHE